MFKYATRLAAVAAIVPISLALSAMPSHADTDQGVTLTGTATCNVATGHATWTLHWTIDNQASHEVPNPPSRSGGASPQSTDFDDITVSSADETGLVTAHILNAVTPNPVPARGVATATDGPVPNAVGDVTLHISWTNTNTQTAGANTATVHLDGSCVLPDVPTTVAPTTTAPPAVKTAVAAAPAFTG